MLDQNTDRMWYVIGAVIIGAAIIFILNGTMPELFASVGQTFSDKSDETLVVASDIHPYDSQNVLRNSDFSNGLKGWAVNGTASVEIVDGHTVAKVGPGDWNLGGGIHQSPIFDVNRAAEVSFEAKAVSGSAQPIVGFLNVSGQGHVIDVSDQWETYRFTTDKIDISVKGANIFHIYSNYTELYVTNVHVRGL